MIKKKKNIFYHASLLNDWSDKRFWKFIPRPRLAIRLLERIWKYDLNTYGDIYHIDNTYGKGREIIYHEYDVVNRRWIDIHSRKEYFEIFGK